MNMTEADILDWIIGVCAILGLAVMAVVDQL